MLCGAVIWGRSLAGVAAPIAPEPAGLTAPPSIAAVAAAPAQRSGPAGGKAAAGVEPPPEPISLQQVLAIGMPASLDLERGQRRLARDQAAVQVGIASRLPQLFGVASGSFTQVGTSVGVITDLPTLGDISLEIGRAHV